MNIIDKSILQELADLSDQTTDELELDILQTAHSNKIDNDDIVVISTAFSGTSKNPEWHEKQLFERKYILEYVSTHFGDPPNECLLKWTKNPHDAGTYCEMELSMNWNNEEHVAYYDSLQGIDSEKLQSAINDAWKTKKCKVIQLTENHKSA